MTRTLQGVPLAFVIVLAAGGPAAAQASTATVDLRASLISALTITPETPLSFGTIIPLQFEAAVVTVSPDGLLTSSAPVTAPSGVPPAPGPFRVTGQANAFFQIALPTGGTITSGSASMRLSDFIQAVEGGQAGPGLGQLDASGRRTFYVGATLTVNPEQPAGEYVGTYPVTVRYQ